MMKTHLLFVFFVEVFTACLAASITPVKCPSIQSDQQLQKLRQECVQYENASVPQQLDTTTQKQVLCLLYLSSYNRACNKNVQIPASGITPYNITSICANTELLVEGAEELGKLLKDKITCVGTCIDLLNGATVVVECNTALYLNNLTHALVAEVNKTIESKKVVASPEQNQQDNKTAGKPSDPQEVENPIKLEPEVPQVAVQDVRPKQLEDQLPKKDAQVAVEGAAAAPAAVAPAAKAPVVVASNPENKPAEQPAAVVEKVEAVNHNAAKPAESLNPPAAASNAQNLEQTQQHDQQEPAVDVQREDQPSPVQPQNDHDHIDSPLLINGDTNNAILNANDNENPEGVPKFEDPEDGDGDDDDFDEQGEQKYNKPSSNDDKAPASLPQKPDKTYSSPVVAQSTVDGDSYFFSYFMMLCIIIVLFYVGYHNKQKIRAIVLEGPRGRRQYRSRRPNSANYHKLDSNLEEAITSSTANKTSSHVIY